MITSQHTDSTMEANFENGLEYLLELNGWINYTTSGYWWKIEARRVPKTVTVPHGIRYNLTLHDNHDQRVYGMDNSHAVISGKRGVYHGRSVTYDHLHKGIRQKGTPYMFTSPCQLLDDFWQATDSIIKDVKRSE